MSALHQDGVRLKLLNSRTHFSWQLLVIILLRYKLAMTLTFGSLKMMVLIFYNLLSLELIKALCTYLSIFKLHLELNCFLEDFCFHLEVME